MSQPNFPPARLFDAFAKPTSTEQPAKKDLLGKLGLGESSKEDNYTTVMLVGFNSAKEPPGNGEDALDVIHRAFDPCDESPGFDMDDFYDYGSVAPQLLNNDDSESTVLVWPKMFYNMVTIPERRLRTHADEWEAELAEEMAKDYEKVELVREIEQKMDSTLRTVSGEVIAEDIEGYLDSLSGASGAENPADDGAGSAEDSSER